MRTRDLIIDYFVRSKELSVKKIAKDLAINPFIVKALVAELSRNGVIQKVRKEGLVHIYTMGSDTNES